LFDAPEQKDFLMPLPTLLYVDDQQENLSNFRISFQNEYNVVTASSGSEALDLYKKLNEISIVLSDQRMPGMSGSELMEILYKLNPHPIRIIITAYSDRDAIISAINKGHVYQYLIKPWDEPQMRVLFNRAVQYYNASKQNRLLLQELETKNKRLKAANEELLELNLKLNLDVARRKTLEKELKNYTDKLEVLVEERTSELAAANVFLKREISDRRAAQERLRASKLKLSRLMNETSDLVWETDASNAITCMGPRVADILGRSQQESQGKNIALFLFGGKFDKSSDEFLKKIESKRPFPIFEINALDAEGRPVSMEICGVPFADKNGNFQGYYGLARNISKRKTVEKEMVAAARMESVAVISGGVAHDFNNILMAVMGNVSIVRSKLSHDKDLYNLLGLAEEGCEKAGELTRQLMAFTKGGCSKKELMTIQNLLESHLRLAVAGSNTKIDLDISPSIKSVEIDKAQIGQAISNLVINAVQAMDGSGTLRVTAKNASDEETPSSLDAAREYIVLQFEDQGDGIAEKYLGKLFEPFFTTKDNGSGLGLAIAQQIVKNHNGAIAVKTNKGVGTTFSIYLPVAEAGENPKESSSREKMCRFKAKTLLIEDEHSAAKSCVGMLAKLGLDVVVATDGKEAFERYERAWEEAEPFDLAVLNFAVQGSQRAKEAVTKLKKINPNAKTIVINDNGSDDPMTGDLHQFGFSAALSRPLTMEAMTTTLSGIL